ncbi:MAG: penicillin-binding protein 2 [Dehalococcoidia bacterium]|nr:penicillin-binding protein 2 [Dehalococcoidia bacterium]
MNSGGFGSRLLFLRGFSALAGLVLVGRLVQLQAIEDPRYRQVAADERLRTIELTPPRGRILDRRGTVVATNVAEYALAMIPGDLPSSPDERRLVLAQLERETGQRYAELERRAAIGNTGADPLAPILIRKNVSHEDAVRLRSTFGARRGVRIETSTARQYAGNELLAHVLGHVAPIAADEVAAYAAEGYALDARAGQSGLELSYERMLRGVPGEQLVRATNYGRTLSVLRDTPPQAGADLLLSIDLELQRATRGALDAGIKHALTEFDTTKWKNPNTPREAGAAVVLDVRSGEVLALVSLPSFEANLLGSARDDVALEAVVRDPSRRLVDRTHMEVHPPGSIFKPLVAAAALQEGVARPSTTITSTGAILIRDQYRPEIYYVFRDWAAHGSLNLYGGIARSSDVYFYYLAGGYAEAGRAPFEGLGVQRLARYAMAAGMGARTDLDLPGEATGLVPDAGWKEREFDIEWVLGDTYTLGIGQGYLTVTPLQMAVMTAAIANGGDVLVPRVAAATRRGGVDTPTLRRIQGHLPVDPANLEVVREAMRMAADPGGTADLGEPAGMTIGGKTGTAEFGQIAADGSYDSHAWYIGFAPYDRPEVAVAVYLEHGIGAAHAAPTARAILEAYFRLRDAALVNGLNAGAWRAQ